ncbi:MAG: carbohydrate kinase [Rhizobiales bacterium]|nr:carbohydrate kinase [Hyphomicrobiales bacterium]
MIVCCGEALIDFLPRTSTEGQSVYQPFCGGSIFNTAIALSRLGHKTGFFCSVSKDFFGDMLIDGLKASGVDLRYVRRAEKPSTLAFVKLEGGQARYSFFDENSAVRLMAKKDVPKLPVTVKALHFGSISLIPEPCGGTLEFLLKREAKAKVISLDPNIRASLIKDRKSYLARINRLIPFADVLKISDEDTHWITGSKDLDNAAKGWLKKGARIVVITRGGEGVIAFTGRARIEIPPVKVKVADTVGAGDTFTAGTLFALSKAGLLTKPKLAAIGEAQLRSVLEFAARAAAITVSRPGADPPWAKEMAL